MSTLALVLNVGLIALVVVAFSLTGRIFGPRPKHEGDAEVPYETGMRPLSADRSRMAVLYWRFAVLFVVFDVDLALLMPWAFNRPLLDLGLMVSMTVFMGLVAFMLAYFWRKGVLECD